MKLKLSLLGLSLATAFATLPGYSATPGQGSGQVFFRGGVGILGTSRASQIFTDTAGASGLNDGEVGWSVGAGLNLSLWQQVGPGSILGEIFANYTEFSNKTVRQTTSALLGGTAQHKVAVSELSVSVSPKYRFDELVDGNIKPWIIPVGLAFLVNSPPSDNSNYLDVGYHAGLGIEYLLFTQASLGADFRYTYALGRSGVDASNASAAGYLAVNF